MGRAGTGVGFSGGAYGIEELQEAIEDVNYAHAVIDDVSPRQVAPCRPPFSCKINHGEMHRCTWRRWLAMYPVQFNFFLNQVMPR